jgi:TPP-dependent pyruvate/acetoin dehydrogenase alpha subunit
VDEAIAKAQADPYPELKELKMDVYFDNENHYMRGVELKDSHIPGR